MKSAVSGAVTAASAVSSSRAGQPFDTKRVQHPLLPWAIWNRKQVSLDCHLILGPRKIRVNQVLLQTQEDQRGLLFYFISCGLWQHFKRGIQDKRHRIKSYLVIWRILSLIPWRRRSRKSWIQKKALDSLRLYHLFFVTVVLRWSFWNVKFKFLVTHSIITELEYFKCID